MHWGRLEWYAAGTALAGLAAFGWAVQAVSLTHALIAIVAVFVADFFATTARDEMHVSLMNVVIFVSLLVGGVELAVVASVGTAPGVLYRVHRRHDPLMARMAFNAGQVALSALAAGVTYAVLVSVMDTPFPSAGSLLAILAASVSFSLANYGLVSTAVSISAGERWWSTFRTCGPVLLMQVPYVGIAVLAAVVLERASTWALLFMVVPVLIARYGLLAFQRLDESYDQLVRTFVKAIEIKDLYTRGHSERVAQLSVLVAEQLGVPYDQRRLTRYAALLHDVGKIGVPLCIINKPGPLDDDEFAEIKKHPSIGADILHDIDFLAPAIDIVRYHHERLDGRGYPHGVDEEELSDIVRIVTAVDAFDAMTSTRSYRKALEVPEAVAELRRCVGHQFDTRMVEALALVVERIGWEPTIDFASEAELHGEQIPTGTAQDRFSTLDAPETGR